MILWNPTRDDILRMDWPAGVPADVIKAALNKIPGRRIRNVQRLRERASDLRLKRPAWFRTACNERAALIMHEERRRLARGGKRRRKIGVRAARRQRARSGWTPERNTLLIELWPTDMPGREVEARINALPGPVLSRVLIWSQARRLCVRRPVVPRKPPTMSRPVHVGKEVRPFSMIGGRVR